MEENKKVILTCECCKRPFKRPNTPFYNLCMYGLGVVCMDCASKIEVMFREKGGFAIGRNAKEYIKKVGVNESFAPSITYNKNNYQPFEVSLQVGNGGWSNTTTLATLDEVKKLRDALTKFIDECEI